MPIERPAIQWFCAGLVFVSGLMVGCDSGPRRVEITGNVTLEKKLIPSGSISVLPGVGQKGPAANGTVEQGAFHIPSDEGPYPGPHRLVIEYKPPKDELLKAQNEGRKPRTVWEFEIDIPDKPTFHRELELNDAKPLQESAQ